MASGGLSLLEATKSSSDMKKAGLVETIIMGSSIIDELPWIPFAGNAMQQSVEDTLPSVQFRPVYGTYTRSYGTDTKRFWGVAILGGEFVVDKFLVNVTGTEDDLEAKQWAKYAKANAMRFNYEFFNGDGSGDGFVGLKSLIGDGLGQSYAHSTTGATISLASLDASLDLFRNQGGPQKGLLNRTVRQQITNAARTTITGVSLLDVGTDSLGKKVVSYDGVPFEIMEDCQDSTGAIVPVLPFTEDPGDATSDCASLYWIKYGEDDVAGILGHNGEMTMQSFGELQSAPQRMGRFEWYPGVAVFNKYSVVRVTGITAS